MVIKFAASQHQQDTTNDFEYTKSCTHFKGSNCLSKASLVSTLATLLRAKFCSSGKFLNAAL